MNNIVELESNHIIKENIEKLKQIFPDIVSNGKIDFDTLKTVLGEEVETDKENYKFEWVGKKNCYKTIQTPSNGTLKYIKEDSLNPENSENLIIEGDNLEVLKLLQSSYKNSIKMIYIDPPYNTGNDFVYPDNFETPLDNYFELTGQKENGETTQSKKSKEGRKHTQWLNMVFPRLLLSRTLLKEDGFIFISIDDNEIDNLKNLCNEVFGEENFIGKIVVKSNPGGRDYGGISLQHEYVLVYSKNSLSELNMVEDKDKVFKYKDEISEFDDRELRNRNIKFNDINRPNLCYPFYVNIDNIDSNGFYEVSLDKKENWVEVYPLVSQGVQTVWRWGKKKVLENLNVNVKGKKKQDGTFQIIEKYRSPLKRERSIFDEKNIRNEYGTLSIKEIFGKDKPFDYPKSPVLIKRLLNLGMSKNDIVLDFFGGSGTTGQSVLELNKEDNGNRKFILVQLPEPTSNPDYPTISEITKERIRRVINGYGDNPQPINGGFKVFKLDNSNYKLNEKINVNSGSYKEDIIKRLREQFHTSTVYDESLVEGYTQSDIIYENIIKEGYNLNSKIEVVEDISECKVYKITDSVKKDKKFYITFDKVDTSITDHKEFMGISNDTLFICFDNHLYDSDKQNLTKTFQLKTM